MNDIPDQLSHTQPQFPKLAGRKYSLYNPALPTYRQMERDDMLAKLPDEHCRHTTELSRQDFARAADAPFHVKRTSITPGMDAAMTLNANVADLHRSQVTWSRFINSGGGF